MPKLIVGETEFNSEGQVIQLIVIIFNMLDLQQITGDSQSLISNAKIQKVL